MSTSAPHYYFPLIISAATYDSTLCGWKYMVETQRFETMDEHFRFLKQHMLEKKEQHKSKRSVKAGKGGEDEDEGYVGYIAADAFDDNEEEDAVAAGDDATEDDAMQEDDPEAVLAFLKAVEEEQKKVVEEKRASGLMTNEDDEKAEEFFDFLEAARREQLKRLNQDGQENDKDSDEENDDAGEDGDDNVQDYEQLDTLMRKQRSLEEQQAQIAEDAEEKAGRSFGAQGKKPLFDVDSTGKPTGRLANTDQLYPLYSYNPHIGAINSLDAFGTFLVSGGNDEKAIIYNMAARREQSVLSKMEGSLRIVRFLKNGRYILLGLDSGQIDLHDFSSNMYCVWSSKAHKGEVSDIAVHPSNRCFLSVGLDSTLKLWNLITGTLACSIRLRQSASSVQWSPSGASFAVVLNDTVLVYETEKMTLKYTLRHENRVTCVQFLSETLLATAGENKAITVFDISGAEGECLHRLEVHESRIKQIACVQLNIDEFLIVSVDSRGGIAVWRLGEAYALLECYEMTGARFLDVKINAPSTLRHFVQLRKRCYTTEAVAPAAEEQEEKEEEVAKPAAPAPAKEDMVEDSEKEASSKKQKKNKDKKKSKKQEEAPAPAPVAAPEAKPAAVEEDKKQKKAKKDKTDKKRKAQSEEESASSSSAQAQEEKVAEPKAKKQKKHHEAKSSETVTAAAPVAEVSKEEKKKSKKKKGKGAAQMKKRIR